MKTRGFNAVTVILGVTTVLFAGLAIWMFMNYTEAQSDLDSKLTAAEAKAKKEQADADEAKFLELEKQPFNQFTGPDDYGRLTFDYPKNWDAYQATDVSQGGGVTYEAYLHPKFVPPVTKTQKFALRVMIEQKTYEQVLKTYDGAIKSGTMKSSAFTSDHISGTKLEGNFTNDIRGTAIVVKMRDRTLTIRTDADVFRPDFESIIKTVEFNE